MNTEVAGSVTEKLTDPYRIIRSSLGRVRRILYMALGCLMVLFGVIGVFLPLMPTTEFLIAAVWFFARSSPRLEALILSHPKFGPLVRDWQEQGVMPRRAKWMAWGGMTIGYSSFLYHTRPSLLLACLVAAFMLTGAIWIAFRPEKHLPTPEQSGRSG
jgi:uncharacterized membrane protein YbaN (DUF454 family)